MSLHDCDVVVVGLGGFGSAALLHLAARGLSVVGVEAHGVPHTLGSSTGETRVIRKAYFEDARYVPLLRRAYELWATLARDVDETLMERAGCLTFGPPTHPAVIGVQAAAREHALDHEVLDDDGIASRFPGLQPNRGDVGVYESDAGFLHVERCTVAHVSAAQRVGARVFAPGRVTAMRAGRDSVEVDVDDGHSWRARHVVLAAGAWLAADPVLRAFAGHAPLVVERQVQLWFEPGDVRFRVPRLPCFIHFGKRGTFYAIPGRDDLCSPGDTALKACRHHGGVSTTPDDVDREVRAADVDDVRAFLRDHMPYADGPPVRSKVCLYTNTPDENFLIGWSPSSSRVLVLGGCSGHGYKMASVIGEIAADLVVDGDNRLDKGRFDLGLFDPQRFTAA